MNPIGELIEVISRRAGLANVGDVSLSRKKRRRGAPDDTPDARAERSPDGQVRDLLDVVGSDLLDFGQLLIAGMKMTTGDGEPDIGAQFDQGHKDFVKAGEALRAAVPDHRWDGAGSRAYADQNTRQQMRTETMADADRAVQSVLAREAIQIKMRRDTLDDQSDLLAKTSYATFPLQFIPRYGEAAKLAIEGGALQGALQVCAYALYQLHSEVSDNAAELSQAVGRYAGVADGADAPGGGFDPPEPPGGVGLPNTEPTEPTDGGAGGGTTSPGAGGSVPAGGPVMPGSLPPNTSIGGLPPQLDLPQPGLPNGSTATTPGSSPSAPIAGMPAPGGAAGALASVVGPLAGLVTGLALAAGQAAAAGHGAQADDAEDEDVDEAIGKAEEDRDGDPQDQIAPAEPGPGAADRAPIGVVADPEPTGQPAPLTDSVNPQTSPGPSAGMTPQDRKLGEGVHVGG